MTIGTYMTQSFLTSYVSKLKSCVTFSISLDNPDFAAGSICNWKTTGRSDILKDYYFQTSKPISIFKGQLLEIEPIWKPKSIETQAVQLRDF